MIRTFAAALLAGATMAAAAQPIYKCGPGGRTYSQTPCTDGQVLESSDPRTAAQRREARRAAERERELAARLERERLAAERAPKAGAAAATVKPADPADPAASRPGAAGRKQKPQATSRDFTAVVPVPARPPTKNAP